MDKKQTRSLHLFIYILPSNLQLEKWREAILEKVEMFGIVQVLANKLSNETTSFLSENGLEFDHEVIEGLSPGSFLVHRPSPFLSYRFKYAVLIPVRNQTQADLVQKVHEEKIAGLTDDGWTMTCEVVDLAIMPT